VYSFYILLLDISDNVTLPITILFAWNSK